MAVVQRGSSQIRYREVIRINESDWHLMTAVETCWQLKWIGASMDCYLLYNAGFSRTKKVNKY